MTGTHTQPSNLLIKSPPPPENTERLYYATATGFGLVGTGKTPSAANADLMQKIRELNS